MLTVLRVIAYTLPDSLTLSASVSRVWSRFRDHVHGILEIC